jgi:hypothetical protein
VPPEAAARLGIDVEFLQGVAQLVVSRDGASVLRRSLGDLACRELAETVALVVERFLREVEWSGTTSMEATARRGREATPEIPVGPGRILEATKDADDGLDATKAGRLDADAGFIFAVGAAGMDAGASNLGLNLEPPAASLDAALDAGADARAEVRLDAGADPRAEFRFDAGVGTSEADAGQLSPTGFRFDVVAGGGAQLSTAAPAPAFALELGLSYSWLRFGVLAEAPVLPALPLLIGDAARGSLNLLQLGSYAHIGPVFPLGPVFLEPGILGGVLMTRAEPVGTLSRQQIGFSVLPGAGGFIRASWVSSVGLAVVLHANAGYFFGSSAFAIEGAGIVWKSSPFHINGLILVGWAPK